jgi:hypothetical protein
MMRLASRLVVLVGMSIAKTALSASSEDVALARELGIKGVKLAEAGDCASAIPVLERAEALVHAPTFLLRIGECQIALGRLVDGSETLRRVVREVLAPAAPAAFVAAKTRAAQVLDKTRPRIPRVVISVRGALPVDSPGIVVTVDDVVVPNAALDVERPIDPGRHVVVARAPGHAPARREIEVAEGARVPVDLELGPLPGTPSASGPLAAPKATPPGASWPRVVAYGAFGGAAAALAVGTFFALDARGRASDLKEACVAGACPPEREDELRDARTRASIATISYGAGLALVTTGVLLVVFEGRTGSKTEAKVQAAVGPKGILLQGTF